VALELLKSVKLSLYKMNCSKIGFQSRFYKHQWLHAIKTKAGSNCEKSCKNTEKILKLQIAVKAQAGKLNEI
jgi:hypothetical protein